MKKLIDILLIVVLISLIYLLGGCTKIYYVQCPYPEPFEPNFLLEVDTSNYKYEPYSDINILDKETIFIIQNWDSIYNNTPYDYSDSIIITY